MSEVTPVMRIRLLFGKPNLLTEVQPVEIKETRSIKISFYLDDNTPNDGPFIEFCDLAEAILADLSMLTQIVKSMSGIRDNLITNAKGNTYEPKQPSKGQSHPLRNAKGRFIKAERVSRVEDKIQ